MLVITPFTQGAEAPLRIEHKPIHQLQEAGGGSLLPFYKWRHLSVCLSLCERVFLLTLA